MLTFIDILIGITGVAIGYSARSSFFVLKNKILKKENDDTTGFLISKDPYRLNAKSDEKDLPMLAASTPNIMEFSGDVITCPKCRRSLYTILKYCSCRKHKNSHFHIECCQYSDGRDIGCGYKFLMKTST